MSLPGVMRPDSGGTVSLLLFLAILLTAVTRIATAPLNEDTSLETYDGESSCYYNFQHYGEGDRIMTNEPCLNCTCHNRMLMCYLRVCPFTKPIGQDCTIEKRGDQCCPVITCPDVRVDLLTSTATLSPEGSSTDVGHLDQYGCTINERFFSEGAKVPPNPNKPCELCYCIRNRTACVMQECTLHVDGCTPIYHKGVCCPVRYSCEHPQDEEIPMIDDMTTTVRPTPGFIITTTDQPAISTQCVHEDNVYLDGASITREKTCEHCYCMKGRIICAVQECGMPMENEGKNCTALPPREGQCCPDTYICENDIFGSTQGSDETTALPVSEIPIVEPSVSEEDLDQKPEQVLLTEQPENVKSEVTPASPEAEPKPTEGISETETTPASTAEDTTKLIAELSTLSPISEEAIPTTLPTEEEKPIEVHESVTPGRAENETPEAPVVDSTISQLPETEQETTALPQVINPVDNEIEDDKFPQLPSRIPGEGSCLVDGSTYPNNSAIPVANKCQSTCRCISSIVRCDSIPCAPPPSNMASCEPVQNKDACCPTYTCTPELSKTPDPDNQMTEAPIEEEEKKPDCAVADCIVTTELTVVKPDEMPPIADGSRIKKPEEEIKESECTSTECQLNNRTPELPLEHEAPSITENLPEEPIETTLAVEKEQPTSPANVQYTTDVVELSTLTSQFEAEPQDIVTEEVNIDIKPSDSSTNGIEEDLSSTEPQKIETPSEVTTEFISEVSESSSPESESSPTESTDIQQSSAAPTATNAPEIGVEPESTPDSEKIDHPTTGEYSTTSPGLVEKSTEFETESPEDSIHLTIEPIVSEEEPSQTTVSIESEQPEITVKSTELKPEYTTLEPDKSEISTPGSSFSPTDYTEKVPDSGLSDQATLEPVNVESPSPTPSEEVTAVTEGKEKITAIEESGVTSSVITEGDQSSPIPSEQVTSKPEEPFVTELIESETPSPQPDITTLEPSKIESTSEISTTVASIGEIEEYTTLEPEKAVEITSQKITEISVTEPQTNIAESDVSTEISKIEEPEPAPTDSGEVSDATISPTEAAIKEPDSEIISSSEPTQTDISSSSPAESIEVTSQLPELSTKFSDSETTPIELDATKSEIPSEIPLEVTDIEPKPTEPAIKDLETETTMKPTEESSPLPSDLATEKPEQPISTDIGENQPKPEVATLEPTKFEQSTIAESVTEGEQQPTYPGIQEEVKVTTTPESVKEEFSSPIPAEDMSTPGEIETKPTEFEEQSDHTTSQPIIVDEPKELSTKSSKPEEVEKTTEPGPVIGEVITTIATPAGISESVEAGEELPTTVLPESPVDVELSSMQSELETIPESIATTIATDLGENVVETSSEPSKDIEQGPTTSQDSLTSVETLTELDLGDFVEIVSDLPVEDITEEKTTGPEFDTSTASPSYTSPKEEEEKEASTKSDVKELYGETTPYEQDITEGSIKQEEVEEPSSTPILKEEHPAEESTRLPTTENIEKATETQTESEVIVTSSEIPETDVPQVTVGELEKLPIETETEVTPEKEIVTISSIPSEEITESVPIEAVSPGEITTNGALAPVTESEGVTEIEIVSTAEPIPSDENPQIEIQKATDSPVTEKEEIATAEPIPSDENSQIEIQKATDSPVTEKEEIATSPEVTAATELQGEEITESPISPIEGSTVPEKVDENQTPLEPEVSTLRTTAAIETSTEIKPELEVTNVPIEEIESGSQTSTAIEESSIKPEETTSPVSVELTEPSYQSTVSSSEAAVETFETSTILSSGAPNIEPESSTLKESDVSLQSDNRFGATEEAELPTTNNLSETTVASPVKEDIETIPAVTEAVTPAETVKPSEVTEEMISTVLPEREASTLPSVSHVKEEEKEVPSESVPSSELPEEASEVPLTSEPSKESSPTPSPHTYLPPVEGQIPIEIVTESVVTEEEIPEKTVVAEEVTPELPSEVTEQTEVTEKAEPVTVAETTPSIVVEVTEGHEVTQQPSIPGEGHEETTEGAKFTEPEVESKPTPMASESEPEVETATSTPELGEVEKEPNTSIPDISPSVSEETTQSHLTEQSELETDSGSTAASPYEQPTTYSPEIIPEEGTTQNAEVVSSSLPSDEMPEISSTETAELPSDEQLTTMSETLNTEKAELASEGQPTTVSGISFTEKAESPSEEKSTLAPEVSITEKAELPSEEQPTTISEVPSIENSETPFKEEPTTVSEISSTEDVELLSEEQPTTAPEVSITEKTQLPSEEQSTTAPEVSITETVELSSEEQPATGSEVSSTEKADLPSEELPTTVSDISSTEAAELASEEKPTTIPELSITEHVEFPSEEQPSTVSEVTITEKPELPAEEPTTVSEASSTEKTELQSEEQPTIAPEVSLTEEVELPSEERPSTVSDLSSTEMAELSSEKQPTTVFDLSSTEKAELPSEEQPTVAPEIYSTEKAELPTEGEESAKPTTPEEEIAVTEKLATESAPADLGDVQNLTTLISPASSESSESDQPNEIPVSESVTPSEEITDQAELSTVFPGEEKPDTTVLPVESVVAETEAPEGEVSEPEKEEIPITPSEEAVVEEITAETSHEGELESSTKSELESEQEPSGPSGGDATQGVTLDDRFQGQETTPAQLPSGGEAPVPGYGSPGDEMDYDDRDHNEQEQIGPGTCRYGGKVYVSAQQIPRDDPCDFCFCFRSDIICLQQSCPPPIHGCHEEPINGFCCPRYECPVSMATSLNVTTTTTTTTTTLPPHFLPHAYKGAARRQGCQIKGHAYKVGEVVRASSGPCLHCTCGGDGQMKCEPKACTPEPMLRQMIAAAVSSSRRRR